MKSTALIGIFAIALASALNVGVTISIDKDLNLPSSFKQASGTCRGIEPVLDKRVSSIAPDWGVICTLFEGKDCSGDSLRGIIGPNTHNLGQDDFDNKASSMICSGQ